MEGSALVAHAHTQPALSETIPVTTPSGVWVKHLPGRFRRISVHQLSLAVWLYRTRQITRRQLQVYFAAHEMAERRRYTRTDAGGRKAPPLYTIEEVRSLVGGPDTPAGLKSLTRDVKALGRLGLCAIATHRIDFAARVEDVQAVDPSRFWEFFAAIPNKNRCVPVPRRVCRALAGGFRPAVMVLAIALLVRTLFWHRDGGLDGEGGFRLDGRTKLSWVAATFDLSRRAVGDAQATLLALGFVKPLPATQWQLNRWGARYQLNIEAFGPASSTASKEREEQHESASPSNPEEPKSASPDLNRSASPSGRDLINRKSARVRSGPTGGGRDELPEPRLTNVQPEDLVQLNRTLALHRQAVAAGMIGAGEAGRVEFLAMVDRARTQGQQPERLLVWMLKNRRGGWVSASNEEAAAERVRTIHNGLRQQPRAVPPVRPKAQLDEDDRLVQACQLVAAKLRRDPFRIARSQSGWSRERWDEAVAKFEAKRRERWGGGAPETSAPCRE